MHVIGPTLLATDVHSSHTSAAPSLFRKNPALHAVIWLSVALLHVVMLPSALLSTGVHATQVASSLSVVAP